MEETELRVFCNQTIELADMEQKRAILNFAKFDYSKRCIVFKNQKSIFHQLKLKPNNSDISNEILSYCSFMIAIDRLDGNDDEFKKRVLQFNSKKTRKTRKKEKLASLFAIIKDLKEKENFTFRQISSYLKKYHKVDVVHSTIYQFYMENK